MYPSPPMGFPPMEGTVKLACMGNVYAAVASGRMSVQKAAEEHGAPKPTLNGKVSGKVALKTRSGTRSSPC